MLIAGSKELNEIYRLAYSECDLVSFGGTDIFLKNVSANRSGRCIRGLGSQGWGDVANFFVYYV
jgi:hypothetical protein